MLDDNYSDSFDEIESHEVNKKPNPFDKGKPSVPVKPEPENNKFEIQSDNESLDFKMDAYQPSAVPKQVPEKPLDNPKSMTEPSKTPLKQKKESSDDEDGYEDDEYE